MLKSFFYEYFQYIVVLFVNPNFLSILKNFAIKFVVSKHCGAETSALNFISDWEY